MCKTLFKQNRALWNSHRAFFKCQQSRMSVLCRFTSIYTFVNTNGTHIYDIWESHIYVSHLHLHIHGGSRECLSYADLHIYTESHIYVSHLYLHIHGGCLQYLSSYWHFYICERNRKYLSWGREYLSEILPAYWHRPWVMMRSSYLHIR